MSKRNVLLIEGRGSAPGLRDELAAGVSDLVVIPAARGRLRLPLIALPDVIVLHAVPPSRAEELIGKLRAVGFEMPAVILAPCEAGEGGPGYRCTIDAGALDRAVAVELLAELAVRPAIAAPEVAGDAGGGIAAAPLSEPARADTPPLDAAVEAPTGTRTRRRRAGAEAAPLGRRFQARDL